MKRYRPYYVDPVRLIADGATMRENSSGDWVRYEDAERLQSALFRHACYCGCGDPNHELHREDCAYRVACTPHSKTD